MPLFLCKDCARDNFKPDLTLAGLNQIWLMKAANPEGYGPPCELCGNPVTTYEIQIIGTQMDTEGIVVQKMKEGLMGMKAQSKPEPSPSTN